MLELQIKDPPGLPNNLKNLKVNINEIYKKKLRLDRPCKGGRQTIEVHKRVHK